MSSTHHPDCLPKQIDVALPTMNAEPRLRNTLEAMSDAFDHSVLAVNRLIIVDGGSSDDTLEIAEAVAKEQGWECHVDDGEYSLPAARERLVDLVETEWFFFQDDTKVIERDYLTNLVNAVAPVVGGIHGRKWRRSEPSYDWTRRRARRGNTAATLVQTAAIEDISYPGDMTCLEDEYTRRFVENNGYLWVFHPYARFEHKNAGRHPTGWKEGYIGGKYGLLQFHTAALNVPYTIVTGRNPIPHAKRMAGWLAGRFTTDDSNRTVPVP